MYTMGLKDSSLLLPRDAQLLPAPRYSKAEVLFPEEYQNFKQGILTILLGNAGKDEQRKRLGRTGFSSLVVIENLRS